MSWLKEMFGTDKPIIGMLHLDALPGDPFYDHSGLDKVIDNARRDLDALQTGGIDGVLVTNEFSLPYEKHVSPVTLASMCTVIGALRNEFSVTMGAEAIYDGDATIDLCAATDAAFTRCLFTGAWAGDLGIVDRDIAHTLRHKSALRLDNLKLFYFVSSEDEVYLNDRSHADLTKTLVANCRPDALVMGSAPGINPTTNILEGIVSSAKGKPVFCGTGCNIHNVQQILQVCNGAFVGSSLKKNGEFDERIDLQRVREFMEHVRSFR